MKTITPLEHARRTRAAGAGYVDLVSSSFRAAGLVFSEHRYRVAWERWRSHPEYRPSGSGSFRTREVVAQFLTSDGLPTRPEQVLLTAGSSISYLLLFRMLAAGTLSLWTTGLRTTGLRTTGHRKTIALPQPGYPLFENLARDAGLEPLFYHLSRRSAFSDCARAIGDLLTEAPPAAVVLISPNNPSGAIYSEEDIDTVRRLCGERDVPIISDEVFSSFRPDNSELPRAAAPSGTSSGTAPPLVFTLNGLSKLCAAPELKLGWIAVHGDPARTGPILEELDTRHDTYLSVSGYAEAAGQVFLEDDSRDARSALADAVRGMQAELHGALNHLPGVTVIGGADSSGGIHRVIQLDGTICADRFRTLDDAEISRQLVRDYGVYLHPGYLYDLTDPASREIDPLFVMTCLNRTGATHQGLERLRRALCG